MHKIAIPDYAMRLMQKRGVSDLILEGIVPLRSALLVVDMQNAFVAPGGQMEVPNAREMVPDINRLANVFREAGGTVCWIQTNFRDEAERWSVWFTHRLTPEFSAAMIAALSPGNWGYELYPELVVNSSDLRITKTRFSPFIQGASNLDDVLKRRGIDTIVITGAVSNTCCESTARDAMMLNYKTIFVSDGNATRTDEEHNATLANMVQVFADVVSTEKIVQKLARCISS